MKNLLKNGFNATIIILLVLNLIVSAIGLMGSSVTQNSVKETIKSTIELRQYKRDIGKKHLKVVDDRVSTASYGSKEIVGTVVNKSKNLIEEVSVNITFYKDNEVIGYETDYITKIGPNAECPLSIYLYDEYEDFDEYTIDYIEGMIYK